MSVVKCLFKCSRTVVYVFLRTVHAFAYFSVEFLVSFLRALYIYICYEVKCYICEVNCNCFLMSGVV